LDFFQTFLGLLLGAFLFILIVFLPSIHSLPIHSYCLSLLTHILPSDPISDPIISSSSVSILIVISDFSWTSPLIHIHIIRFPPI
jgi:hypothetical protein